MNFEFADPAAIFSFTIILAALHVVVDRQLLYITVLILTYQVAASFIIFHSTKNNA